MIKVIVAGGREFSDYFTVENSLIRILTPKGQPAEIEIVSGGATGADALGERFAKEQKCPVKRFPAEWHKYGKSAGPRRNEKMAEYADVLVAYWDQRSRGTRSMIDLAKKKGLEVHIIHY